MKKGGLITCVIALSILVIGGNLWLMQSSTTASYTPPKREPPGSGVIGNEKTNQDPYDTTIEYTDNAFTPRDITITQGMRVRFVNHGSQAFWPASGVHPTHTLYPEKEPTDCLGSSFDACKALAPGEFYDFTFYYVGHWSFHDHLHAYNTGSITVAATSSAPSS